MRDLPLLEHFERESKGSCLIPRIKEPLGEERYYNWRVIHDGFGNGIGNGKTVDSILLILNEIATRFVNQKKGDSTFELILYECEPEEYVEENFVDCL